MKIYESKLAHIPGHIFWTFCLYAIIAAILLGLFYLTGKHSYPLYTFLLVIAMWIGQSVRFQKMHYKINEDAFIQYDFHYRTILIEQIVSVHLLDKIQWISFHTPYNMVIKTIDNRKYFIAPKEAKLLVEILKRENPQIQFN